MARSFVSFRFLRSSDDQDIRNGTVSVANASDLSLATFYKAETGSDAWTNPVGFNGTIEGWLDTGSYVVTYRSNGYKPQSEQIEVINGDEFKLHMDTPGPKGDKGDTGDTGAIGPFQAGFTKPFRSGWRYSPLYTARANNALPEWNTLNATPMWLPSDTVIDAVCGSINTLSTTATAGSVTRWGIALSDPAAAYDAPGTVVAMQESFVLASDGAVLANSIVMPLPTPITVPAGMIWVLTGGRGGGGLPNLWRGTALYGMGLSWMTSGYDQQAIGYRYAVAGAVPSTFAGLSPNALSQIATPMIQIRVA